MKRYEPWESLTMDVIRRHGFTSLNQINESSLSVRDRAIAKQKLRAQRRRERELRKKSG